MTNTYITSQTIEKRHDSLPRSVRHASEHGQPRRRRMTRRSSDNESSQRRRCNETACFPPKNDADGTGSHGKTRSRLSAGMFSAHAVRGPFRTVSPSVRGLMLPRSTNVACVHVPAHGKRRMLRVYRPAKGHAFQLTPPAPTAWKERKAPPLSGVARPAHDAGRSRRREAGQTKDRRRAAWTNSRRPA